MVGVALQASEARQAWRLRQGAAAISLDECVVHVADPRAPDPAVTLERVQQWDSPSRTLVSEMMILAGQVAATVGKSAFPATTPSTHTPQWQAQCAVHSLKPTAAPHR